MIRLSAWLYADALSAEFRKAGVERAEGSWGGSKRNTDFRQPAESALSKFYAGEALSGGVL